MTYRAGSAAVSVTPDFKDFHTQIGAELDSLDPRFAAAGDKSGKSFSDAFQAQLKASFANLPNAKITADADTTEAKAELDDAARPRTAKIKVDVDKSSLVKLQNPLSGISPLVGAGIAGGIALGPQALGLGLGLAGLGAAFGAAAVGAGAFGAVAKPMFTDVTKAQKALTTAQDAYNKATTDSARAQALKDEQAALAGLTPAERQLATELTGLESAWKGLQRAEQPVVGQAIAPWLATATSGMSLLKPVIGDAAEAIGILGSQAQSAFTAPFWGTFFSTLGNTGRIAIEDFGHAAGLLGDGLAHLFVTFAPDIDKLPPLVDKAAAAFDRWAKSVNSSGLDSFFKTTFSPANVAALKTDLGNVATIVENIAKAGAGLSPTAFSGLSNVLAVAAKLSPGQIEALAGLFVAGKAVGGFGNAAKLLTGGAGLSLPGIGGKKSAAKTAATEEEEAPAKAGKLTRAGKVAGAAAGVVPVLGAASVIDQAIPKGPGGEWVNSWAPYEKIFTNDLPLAWSTSYEAFQSNFAGPMTNWFTSSLPHFFTAQVPMGWSTAYEGFQRDFAGPLTSWFTTSLPNFFTSSIPANVWSPAYEGFQRDFAGPLTNFFTSTIPSVFSGAGSWLSGAGSAISGGLVTAWNATSGAVTSAFGAAKNWATGALSDAVSWLQGAGRNAASGLETAWNATSGALTAAFAKGKSWATGALADAAGWLKTAGSQAASGLEAAWNATSGAVTSTFAKGKSWATSAFSGAASWLTSAGAAVMSGFANGIIAASGAVLSAARSIANSVVSTIEGALHIGSPSKVTHGLGEFTGQGFGLGILSQVPYVGQSAGQLAMASVQGLASAASVRSLSALGSLGVPSIGGPPRLPGVSSPLSTGPLQLTVTSTASGNQLNDAIVQSLRFSIQGATGGDVQAHLGQGPVRTS